MRLNEMLKVVIQITAVLMLCLSCSSPISAPAEQQQPADLPVISEQPAQESTPSQTIEAAEPVNNGLLGQDLNSLEDPNGEIISAEVLAIEITCEDKVEIYRIRYLSDGLEVAGFILKPIEDTIDHPVLIWNRGGNRDYGINDIPTLKWLSEFACSGYVVLASQYRGNDGGQGQEEFGGNDVNDVLNLIPLAKSLPFASNNKIVMLGGSRGGMMTYIALTKTNEIKAAAVISGIADCIQNYNEREIGMKNVYRELIGGTPDQKLEEYKMRSAVYWPEKINTPVLIIHGDNDWRVNVSQARMLANKLESLNKIHELFIYPEGTHMVWESKRDRDEKILKWFNKYLQDQ